MSIYIIILIIFLGIIAFLELLNLKSERRIIKKFKTKNREEIEDIINKHESNMESKKAYNIITTLSICCSFVILMINSTANELNAFDNNKYAKELEINDRVIEKLLDESIEIGHKNEIYHSYISNATFHFKDDSSNKIFEINIENENDIFEAVEILTEYKYDLNVPIYNNGTLVLCETYMFLIFTMFYTQERNFSYSVYLVKILKKMLETYDYNSEDYNMKKIDNFNLKKNINKYNIMILLVAVVPMVFCLIIMLVFRNSKYGQLLEVNDYFNFIGSFGGAILSAIISLIVLYITVQQTREIQNENKTLQETYDKKQTSLEARKYIPVLDVVNSAENEIEKCKKDTMLISLMLNNKGEVPCNIDGYKISCSARSGRQKIEIENDTRKINVNLLKVFCKDDNKKYNFIINDPEVENLPIGDEIRIYIKLFLTSSLNYKYHQTIGIVLENERINNSKTEITLPIWMDESKN